VNRALDVAVAGGALAVASPFLGLAALAIKLDDGGPVVYRQTRVGKDGADFELLKLRTMVVGAETKGAGAAVNRGDPRITRVGRVLRRLSLDELPQLWNVIRGEMSLIGPRPERPEFIPHLEEAFPLYRLRREVRPGVTGLAQVQLPPDTDLESVRRKLAFDLYYVYNYNLWLDLQLLAATTIYICGMPYSHIGKLALLPNSETVERAYQQLTLRHAPAVQADSAVTNAAVPVVDVEMVPCT